MSILTTVVPAGFRAKVASQIHPRSVIDSPAEAGYKEVLPGFCINAGLSPTVLIFCLVLKFLFSVSEPFL